MPYDFDRLIDRTGTGDVKHSKLTEFFGRDDLLPLWVADMEFATPPFIIQALRRRLEHPILGYTVVPEQLWSCIQLWLQARHGWLVEREWLTFIPGIVKGIGMVVNVFVAPNERVIIQPPVYHPFRLVPQDNGRPCRQSLSPLQSPQPCRTSVDTRRVGEDGQYLPQAWRVCHQRRNPL